MVSTKKIETEETHRAKEQSELTQSITASKVEGKAESESEGEGEGMDEDARIRATLESLKKWHKFEDELGKLGYFKKSEGEAEMKAAAPAPAPKEPDEDDAPMKAMQAQLTELKKLFEAQAKPKEEKKTVTAGAQVPSSEPNLGSKPATTTVNAKDAFTQAFNAEMVAHLKARFGKAN